MKTTNKALALLTLAAFAGCSSYTEIARWKSDIPLNDGEVPLATFVTQNFSYQLFWCVPLCTGVPWTEGNEEIVDDFCVRPFADRATVDGNLLSLRHALDVVGSHRVTQLRTSEDDSSFWSFFFVNRHEVRTECVILKPEAEKAPEAEKTPEAR